MFNKSADELQNQTPITGINLPFLEQAIDVLNEQEQKRLEEAQKTRESRKNLEHSLSFWLTNPNVRDVKDYIALASGAGAVNQLSQYIINAEETSFTGSKLGIITSSSSTARIAVQYLETITTPQSNIEYFETKKKIFDLNLKVPTSVAFIEDKLKTIGLITMVDVLEGAYSSFINDKEPNYLGKAGGSLVNVITQVYKYFAPDEKIVKLFQIDSRYVPDQTSKNDITRKHRFSYICHFLIKDKEQAIIFEKNIGFYLDVISSLNSAHYPADQERLRNAFYSGIDLLEKIFQYVE